MSIVTAQQFKPGSINDILDAIFEGGNQTVDSATATEVIVSSYNDLFHMTLTGSDLAFTEGEPSGGTISSLTFSDNTSDVITLSGLDVNFPIFASALDDMYESDDSTAFDAIFALYRFQYIGSTGDDFDVIGGALNDTITGGGGDDTLFGGSGDDMIFGSAGDDVISGDAGHDTLDGGTSREDFDKLVYTFDEYDEVTGSAYVYLHYDTVIDPQGYTDSISGFEIIETTNQTDLIMGGEDDIQLRTYGGQDIILGGFLTGGGTGAIEVRYDSDEFLGGFGGVYVDLSNAYAIDGFGQLDILGAVARARGTDNSDILIGSTLDNRLRGGDGDDVLVSGTAGTDELRGEGGTDTFVILPGGDVTITDFDQTETLDLSRSGLSSAQIDTLLNAATMSGSDLIIDFADVGMGGMLTLRNFAGTVGDISYIASDGAVQLSTTQMGSGELVGTMEAAILEGSIQPGATSTSFEMLTQDGEIAIFTGSGFTFDAGQIVTGGTISSIAVGFTSHQTGQIDVTSGTLTVPQLFGAIFEQDTYPIGTHAPAYQSLISRLTTTTTGSDTDGAVLLTTSGDDHVTGGLSNEQINGEAGNDTLLGGGGDDTITGGAGNDSLDGGAGIDTLDLSQDLSSFGVSINVSTGILLDGRGSIDSIANFERYIGTFGADTFTGGTGDDVFTTNGGDDIIDGGDGSDWVIYDGSFGLEMTVILNDPGNPAGRALNSHVIGTTGWAVLDNIENVVGTGSSDYIEGNSEDNTLDGGVGGFDVFYGFDGADTFIVSVNGAVIGDFGVTQDLLDLSRLGLSQAEAETLVSSAFEEDSHLKIALANGGEIVLEGIGHVNPADIDIQVGSDLMVVEPSLQGAPIVDVLFEESVDFWAALEDVLLDIDFESSDFFSSSTLLSLPSAQSNLLIDMHGYGFTFDETGEPIAGTITALEIFETGTFEGQTEYFNLAYASGFELDLPNVIYGLDQLIAFDDSSILDSIFGSYRYYFDATDMYYSLFGHDDEPIYLSGHDQNDTLDGGTGNDTLDGYDGDDSLLGNGGNDSLNGGWGDDTLDGWIGDDTLRGGEGDDDLLGYFGDDVLTGGAGNDDIDGEEGFDTLDLSHDYLVTSGAEINIATGTLTDGYGSTDTFKNLERYVGTYGDDTFIGGAGADVLEGRSGDDVYYVDASDTVIEDVGRGTDHVISSGSFTLGANIENLTLTSAGTGTGNELANDLSGSFGADKLYGLDGRDTLSGGAGADTLDGGDDHDTISGGADNDRLFGGYGSDSLMGDDGDDFIYAGNGNDTLEGGAGNDRLFGEGRDDLMLGGSGDDSLRGGDGDDTLQGGEGNDKLFGLKDNDSLQGGDGNDRLYGGEGDDVLEGDAGRDTIRGEEGNDVISGGIDNDKLVGNAGDDTIMGDDGDDFLYGSEGNDMLYGGSGSDSIRGEEGNDTISGGDAYDKLFGGIGDDSIMGDAGNDRLYGEEGNDVLAGDLGRDTIQGNDGDDTISGGDDNDKLLGNAGNDLIAGDAGNDRLYGHTGTDTLLGGAGDDTLQGNEDADVLSGGTGNDKLLGGTGADTFVFVTGDGSDEISDFEAGIDLIDLTGYGFSSQGEVDAATNQIGTDVLISFGSDEILILNSTETDIDTAIYWTLNLT